MSGDLGQGPLNASVSSVVVQIWRSKGERMNMATGAGRTMSQRIRGAGEDKAAGFVTRLWYVAQQQHLLYTSTEFGSSPKLS